MTIERTCRGAQSKNVKFDVFAIARIDYATIYEVSLQAINDMIPEEWCLAGYDEN